MKPRARLDELVGLDENREDLPVELRDGARRQGLVAHQARGSPMSAAALLNELIARYDKGRF
jgi:hypothetical protein